jgi:hypothetical protein
MSRSEQIIGSQSGVNPKGEPFIQLTLDGRMIAQMNPEQVRDFALGLIEAAEAAEQDAFILDFMQKTVGLDLNRAGQVLLDFRRYREESTKKRGGPTSPGEWVLPDSTPKA